MLNEPPFQYQTKYSRNLQKKPRSPENYYAAASVQHIHMTTSHLTRSSVNGFKKKRIQIYNPRKEPAKSGAYPQKCLPICYLYPPVLLSHTPAIFSAASQRPGSNHSAAIRARNEAKPRVDEAGRAEEPWWAPFRGAGELGSRAQCLGIGIRAPWSLSFKRPRTDYYAGGGFRGTRQWRKSQLSRLSSSCGDQHAADTTRKLQRQRVRG